MVKQNIIFAVDTKSTANAKKVINYITSSMIESPFEVYVSFISSYMNEIITDYCSAESFDTDSLDFKEGEEDGFKKAIFTAVQIGKERHRIWTMNGFDPLCSVCYLITDRVEISKSLIGDEAYLNLCDSLKSDSRIFRFAPIVLTDANSGNIKSVLDKLVCENGYVLSLEKSDFTETMYQDKLKNLVNSQLPVAGGSSKVPFYDEMFSDVVEDVLTVKGTREKLTGCMKFLGKGLYHEKIGIDCQDYAKFVFADNGNVILVLSDGCSSSYFAKESAQANVNAIIELFTKISLKEFFEQYPLDSHSEMIISACKDKLNEIKNETGCSRDEELCATLLFAVADEEKIFVGHIGDGFVCGVDENGKASIVSYPDNGITSSHTYFTIMSRAKEYLRLRVADIAEVKQILLCSDGPYAMFKDMDKSNPKKPAESFLAELKKENVRTDSDLEYRIFENITDVSQIFDDWSMLVADVKNDCRVDVKFLPVSLRQQLRNDTE